MGGWQRDVAPPPSHADLALSVLRRLYVEGRIDVEQLERDVERALADRSFAIQVTFPPGLPAAARR
jgi:hypothetical protein